MTSARLRAVNRHIERHYGRRLTLAALARIAGVSRFHFVRAYRAAFGVTPYQHVRATRLRRAEELLSSSTMPVGAICAAVGFRSLGSFSRIFKRETGESPMAWRAKTRRPAYVPGCFLRMNRL